MTPDEEKQFQQMYAKRNQAWDAYCQGRGDMMRYSSMMRSIMRDTFNAGWNARKQADYATIAERPKPALVESDCVTFLGPCPDGPLG